MKRRTFVAQSSLAYAALSAHPLLTSTFQNKPFRLALIGSGWWGMNILREAIRDGNSNLVGICDVDKAQIKTATAEIDTWDNKSYRVYKDYRELLFNEKPEIVIVATPDHWHALCAIEAIKAGAHVYLEKPISHTILEGLAILKASREYDRKVQVGTHRRVSPHNISAMDFLRSGKVGKISSVKCFVNYGQGPGEKTQSQDPPEGLDWDMWCGPAPMKAYNSRIHPKGFRQFLDFANGQIGDWGIHWFDQVLWWTEERYPRTIFSHGDRHIKQDNTDAPDTQYAIYEFEDFTLTWEHKLCAPNSNESSNVGCYFYGAEGTLHLGWLDGWTFYPRKKEQQIIRKKAILNAPDHQNIKELWHDFILSIRNNTRPVCDIEDGFLATNISLLGMLSYKLGRSIEWDGSKNQIIGDKEASALMRREYRSPWLYPV